MIWNMAIQIIQSITATAKCRSREKNVYFGSEKGKQSLLQLINWKLLILLKIQSYLYSYLMFYMTSWKLPVRNPVKKIYYYSLTKISRSAYHGKLHNSRVHRCKVNPILLDWFSVLTDSSTYVLSLFLLKCFLFL